MKCLVVGASGFIGSHVVRRLRFAGMDVYPVGGESRVQSTPVDAAGWRDLFESVGPFDVCLNCAGRAHVGKSLTEPLQDFSGNTQLVFWLLDAIRHHQPECRFVNISSAAVYGNPESLPVHESAPSRPLSPYGWHKRISEQICEEFAVCYGLKTCSVRGFSVYGPGLRKQLFWDLAQHALTQTELRLFGTGTETRDFIYIDDFVTAMICVLSKSPFQGECLNVATGQQTSIETAAKRFLRAFGFSGEINFGGESKPGDPKCWQADISRLRELGFEPAVAFDNGIQTTADWLRGTLAGSQT
jgi:UDP-glucose 4-epimerase